jgi:hypothetical protein
VRVNLPYIAPHPDKPNVGSRCRVRQDGQLVVAIIIDESPDSQFFTVLFEDDSEKRLPAPHGKRNSIILMICKKKPCHDGHNNKKKMKRWLPEKENI